MNKKDDTYEVVVDYIVENQEKFYRLAFSYVRTKQDALDVVQNAICKALENYETLRNIHALRTWFYRIVVNESLLYIKKRKVEVPFEETGEMMDAGQFIKVEEPEVDRNQLHQQIHSLPVELQNIITLHYFEELTFQEVAQVLDMNVNTVKAKLYRGLRKLKLELKEDELWAN